MMRKVKYGNRKTELDGITFDSRKEANRYAELRILEKAGEISNLELQKPFILQPGFVHEGKKIQPIKYVADFVYTDIKARRINVVEDVKSPATRKDKVYQLKKKMMLYVHGIEIKEI